MDSTQANRLPGMARLRPRAWIKLILSTMMIGVIYYQAKLFTGCPAGIYCPKRQMVAMNVEGASVVFPNISNVRILQKTNVLKNISISKTSLRVSNEFGESPDKPQAHIVGRIRKKKGYLTIGIPSIKRDIESPYLLVTLQSLIDNTWDDEKAEIVIVVFLADSDYDYNNRVEHMIIKRFGEYLDSGFIRIMQAEKAIYPALQKLKRNFNDSAKRVEWRSKQVVDFAFMFMYSREISEYYIQIEDDVKTAPNYFTGIKSYVTTANKGKSQWALLEFSVLGFIGKLFKSSDLESLSKFLLLFYDEQPVDWLFRYFSLSKTQSNKLVRNPSLFQHLGLHSSLKDGVQKGPKKDKTKGLNTLSDKNFDDGTKILHGDNPPAHVITSLITYSRYVPEMSYWKKDGYYWSESPKAGDSIYVIFNQPARIKSVHILTGTNAHKKDILKNGRAEIAEELLSSPGSKVKCSPFIPICEFTKGECISDSKVFQNQSSTKCLKIIVTSDQNEWLAVKEIAVFVDSN
ncbi:unnamed protein product [Owenia fusiformis]|uniref:Alpha-1,3-mannosyl-glycoprotein 4-beta-N-acetylglucosaminyltransferase C-like n=1 Tax=Owenia fusiformis TaxID=6347 RepID=A0A8S4NP71_OWEFU|nr:unnamed protein product [Owenia fusiformis]